MSSTRRAAATRIFPCAFALSSASCLAHIAAPEAPAPASGAGWRYEAAASEDAREIAVQAYLAGGVTELGVTGGGERFVRDVEVRGVEGWRAVSRAGAAWQVPECATAGCRVRYRFLLRDAARELDDTGAARAFDRVTVTRPSAWLLHPALARHGSAFHLHVTLPAGVSFVTGLATADDATSSYVGEAARLGMAPYAVFGALETRSADRAGARIAVASQPGALALSDDAVTRWIDASAHAIGGYYGCFPVPRLLVVVVPVDGEHVVRGHALGEGGAVIVVEVGRGAGESALASDWVLPHEMAHMAFPSLDDQHHWLEEGVATYVPPIARARTGALDAERVWAELARGLPKGLPRRADRGLDHTSAWGRTYWGGAMYFLLADLEIRRRTHDRRSLDDALRGILAAGGNITVAWSIEKTLDVGDRAVGVPVLRELYAKMADRPVRVELGDLWASLGVAERAGAIAFDDAAPRAATRRAITAPRDVGAISACPAPPSGALFANRAPRTR